MPCGRISLLKKIVMQMRPRLEVWMCVQLGSCRLAHMPDRLRLHINGSLMASQWYYTAMYKDAYP